MNNNNNLQTSNSNIVTNKTFFLLLIFSFAAKFYIYRNDVFDFDANAWHSQELTMDYSYGFIRRGLVGSFATWIKTSFYISYPGAMKAVQIIGVLLFSIAILIFFASLLKNENDKSFCFISLLYIALDQTGFELTQFGLLDTYIMTLTILMVYLMIKDKALFLIPVLAGICVLIHEAYPLMFFAVIVALLIYRFCYAENRKDQIRYVSVFVITGVVVSLLFIYFYYIHPRLDNPDIEAVLANCAMKLGSETDFSDIRNLWLDPTLIPDTVRYNSQMWIDGKPTATFFMLMKLVIANAIICIPLIILTAKYWIKVISNEQKSYRKILLAVSSISVFMILPLVITQNDQGRWFHDIVFFELLVIGSMYLLNFNNERKVLSGLTGFSVWKALLLVLYAVVYFNLGYGLNYISYNLAKTLEFLGIL